MKRKTFGFIFFLLITTVVVVLIKTVNWLPLAFQHDTLRRYNSVEEVKASLRIKDLYVPAYFPQTISWPPTAIVAQSRPSLAVMMTFHRTGSDEESLVITQTASTAFAHEPGLTLVKIAESAPYKLHNRNALLEVGACRNEEPCSRIEWQEGEYRLAVIMKAPPFELIRIAGSMLH